ncbi:hypothetical protein KAR91_87935 [Candidatus Pacearchaeota archaeon]|nr:hypothetical protein [Candidatus Pacearchaeota archaeon]
MPIPTENLKGMKKVQRGTRIGADDEIMQDVVKLINEFPTRLTLTGIAETLQLRGKYMDVKTNNLRSRIRRRLDILCETKDRRTGESALNRKSELRVDAFGETDGSIRYIWYLPKHEDDVTGETMLADEFMHLIIAGVQKQPEYIKDIFEEWRQQSIASEEVFDVEGFKVSFWLYIRSRIREDKIWVQYIAAELGVEQDPLMEKRTIRRFSTIIEEVWSEVE